MHRQKSNKVIKNVKEKAQINRQSEQKRQKAASNQQNASSLRKEREKVNRERGQKGSRLKGSKVLQRKSTTKPLLKGNSYDNNNNKQELNMKEDLKMLISKNNKKIQNKTSQKDKAPDILKNIEKYCKLLKNIHQKQQDSQKKTSLKDNKQYKAFKKSSFQINRNSTTHQNPQLHNQQKMTANQQNGNSHRYSMQLAANLKAVNEQKQYLIRSRRREEDVDGNVLRTRSRRQSREVIKVCEQYKKNLQADEIKLQKSAKVTNYNSNSQSRNSSSLFASHGFSHIIDSLNKGNYQKFIKSKQDIQNLIKSQKASPDKPPLQDRRKQLKLQKVHEIICVPVKRQPLEIYQPKTELECRFKRSKYFVMQVPALAGRKKQMVYKQDPLLGCEITLIENNIFNQQSGLAQLEL